ncbi:MAG TPA: hypothetical protein VD905_04865 [Flavobacteriales bacterium]|nr:hypothetical protein [Flavobacteriales bacterium]
MEKILGLMVLVGLFASCGGKKRNDSVAAYQREQDSIQLVANKKKLAEHAAEDSLFASDTRSFDSLKATYELPSKLNYKGMSNVAIELAEEEDIFPIGFSNDWKFYSYITIDSYINEGQTMYESMLCIVALDTVETGSYKKIDVSGGHDIRTLWNKNKDWIKTELKRYRIIQKGLSEYKAGNRFATKQGTIELELSETKAQLTSGGKAITDMHGYSVEVHAKNEDMGRKVTVDSLPTITFDVKKAGFLGGFVGKRYLYCLLVIIFEGVTDKPFILFRQIRVPVNPAKYK